LVRRVFLSAPPQRGAWNRRDLLRRLERARGRALLRADAQRRRPFSAGVRADPRAAKERSLRRARARLPGVPPPPLRRIQSRLRSGHVVRIAIERARRGDTDVAASPREMALRVATGARQRRGEALLRLSRPPRLAVVKKLPGDAHLTETKLASEDIFKGKLLH